MPTIPRPPGIALLAYYEGYYHHNLVNDIIGHCRADGSLPRTPTPLPHCCDFVYAPPNGTEQQKHYVGTLRPWAEITDLERFRLARICQYNLNTDGHYHVRISRFANRHTDVIVPFCTVAPVAPSPNSP